MVKEFYFNTKKKLVGQVKERLYMLLVLFLLSAQSQRVIIQGDQNIFRDPSVLHLGTYWLFLHLQYNRTHEVSRYGLRA